MAQPTAVILVVGLTDSLIGEWSPNLHAFRDSSSLTRLDPCLPAVTCSVQSSMLTGASPGEHGVVGNGWFDRTLNEVHFWKQSNALVRGEKVWETARHRDPSVTCANLFWWFNMYSSVDLSVTPRPIYKADGRKIPDCYSDPPDLRDELQARFGTFPLFRFWGPASSIESSRWITDAALHVHERCKPTLTFIYLPHLDYALQQHGPAAPEARKAVGEIDVEVGRLLNRFCDDGVRPIVVSEYAIQPVSNPIHINRVLRQAGYVSVRVEQGLEVLDPGASRAFAIADHQIAHVYVRDRSELDRCRRVCEDLTGVDQVLVGESRAGLVNDRCGDLVLVAASDSWFSYYYWLDDRRAPDFARTVDIHRKPGYDPVELFLDPRIALPPFSIGWRLAMKKMGFRRLMNVIPLDASLVRGSHGRVDGPESPVLITQEERPARLPCTAVRDVILDHLF